MRIAQGTFNSRPAGQGLDLSSVIIKIKILNWFKMSLTNDKTLMRKSSRIWPETWDPRPGLGLGVRRSCYLPGLGLGKDATVLSSWQNTFELEAFYCKVFRAQELEEIYDTNSMRWFKIIKVKKLKNTYKKAVSLQIFHINKNQ